MKEKIPKGITYFRERGFLPFLGKCIKSIGRMMLKRILYYYYRIVTLGRLALDELGWLKRIKPYEGLPEIVVSLTSFPARINTVHKAIETLLVQTYRADRTILWLAAEEFPGRETELPPKLKRLCSKGLEIRWCKNIRSYKKLIPALEDFPKSIIITFDDDLLYNNKMVERVVAGYREKPDCIQCHRITTIVYGGIDSIETIPDCGKVYPEPSFLHKPTGCSGCLYPPSCFYKDIVNVELIMKLAPTNDDIWFWLMGALNGYKVNVVKDNIKKLIYIPKTQRLALSSINDCGERLFFVQLRNILRHYPELDELLLNEQNSQEK